MQIILDTSEIKNFSNTNELLVYSAIKTTTQGGVGIFCVSDNIAEELGISPRTITRAISELLKKGLIEDKSAELSDKRRKGYAVSTSPQEQRKAHSEPKNSQKSNFAANTPQANAAKAKTDKELVGDFEEKWNALADKKALPKPLRLHPSETRYKNIVRLMKEFSTEEINKTFRNVYTSEFLCEKWKGINIEWLSRRSNFVKVMEGNYNNDSTKSDEVSTLHPQAKNYTDNKIPSLTKEEVYKMRDKFLKEDEELRKKRLAELLKQKQQ